MNKIIINITIKDEIIIDNDLQTKAWHEYGWIVDVDSGYGSDLKI
jgi:hypothetical protein